MRKDYEIEINYVHMDCDCMVVGWSANVGFGQLTMYKHGDNFEVETECMGKEFYRQVLEKLVEYMMNNSKIVE